MELTKRLEKLVEARKSFNQLSDAIYEIGGGNLDESRFAVIYLNYEEEMLNQTLAATQHINDENITKYFGAMILDLAEKGETFVAISDQAKRIKINTLVNGLMLMDNYVEEYPDFEN